MSSTAAMKKRIVALIAPTIAPVKVPPSRSSSEFEVCFSSVCITLTGKLNLSTGYIGWDHETLTILRRAAQNCGIKLAEGLNRLRQRPRRSIALLMKTVDGHFDGQVIILDAPDTLKPDTNV